MELRCLAYAMRSRDGSVPAWLEAYDVQLQSDEWKVYDGDAADPDAAFAGRLNPEFEAKLDAEQKRQVNEIRRALKILGLTNVTIELINRILTEKRLRAWIENMRAIALPEIRDQVAQSAAKAIGQVRRANIEISFSLENRRAQQFIRNAALRVADDSTRTLTQTLADELVEGITKGESTDQLATRIETSGKVQATRARAIRIARTETAFAAIKGTEEGWRASGVVYGWKFLLAPDACPVCKALAKRMGERVVKLGENAFDVGTVLEVEGQKSPTILNYEPDPGQGLVIPPVHPHCRCDRVPVLFEDLQP
jgi:hypothetical protein